ncbi:hypothetical protein [Capnocytophaga canimorsus]|uniref:Uncharacterized protein n=2 Tax=Capnocytophaga canimorsus TaxID=28188 RepID=A0A250EZE0_9FLAO|nr:hypothetical protein [Capnocytophaga canimorsus]ATA77168.1 hypothetical protein CGC47_06025 [Capnocytophaga canimorsus]ATA91754.1 hypothetical protein CGC56_05955 [Capnocytophaga canimorsus]AYW37239.1 hypothetical protein D8L92_07995 [Capnocytophaga canimorsus]PJI83684.1 hypothetical protein CLV61_0287 [Capnocytophaga canimorsus]STA72392.1 Uncharacterised protein [Capnocytophaga canimorsus]
MSYIDFDIENNSIFISRGDSRNRNKIKKTDCTDDFTFYEYNGKSEAISFNNFLSLREQDGLKGEIEFKKLLEKNNIPYLYIGQGPFGIERSGVLLDNTKSKRADFLANIKDLGTILFDVKCRSKISFHKGDEKYFYLYISEINALMNLQKAILMPVWLAFLDRNELKNIPTFYFISISTVSNFIEQISKKYPNNEEFEEITLLRLPIELFTEIEEKIIFEVGHKNISEELCEKHTELNIALNRRLKDEIKNTIRNNKCYKSYLSNSFFEYTQINYCQKNEVDFLLKKMIEVNIIEYKSHQILRIFGE